MSRRCPTHNGDIMCNTRYLRPLTSHLQSVCCRILFRLREMTDMAIQNTTMQTSIVYPRPSHPKRPSPSPFSPRLLAVSFAQVPTPSSAWHCPPPPAAYLAGSSDSPKPSSQSVSVWQCRMQHRPTPAILSLKYLDECQHGVSIRKAGTHGAQGFICLLMSLSKQKAAANSKLIS